MKTWQELKKEVWKIDSDRNTAISILRMINVRIKALEKSKKVLESDEFTSLDRNNRMLADIINKL